MVNIIGRSRGPGEKEDITEFISAIPGNIKIGDFVYYELENEDRIVLSRIERREKILGYPDFFLNSVEFNPEELGLSLGFESDEKVETFKATLKILGVYDNASGKFSNARVPPKTGQLIHIADADYLREIFTPPHRNPERIGYVNIGTLLVREDENIEVNLDYSELASKHLAILANTGSGKSYTVGVILEEYASERIKASAVVFDIHSEYKNLERNTVPELRGKFNIVSPMISISDMSVGTLKSMIDLTSGSELSGKMLSLLSDKFYQLKRTMNIFSISDLINEINTADDKATKGALEWRLRQFERYELFNTNQSTSLNDICVPGQITIMDLNQCNDLETKIVLTYFADQIYNARMNYVKRIPDTEQLNFPVSIFIEEAHNFIPARDESPAKEILKQIATGGRKFGVSLALITQRPGLIDENVLSQCNTCILLKIMNDGDKKVISRTVEAASADLIEDLSGLTPGQAVVVGPCIKTPALVKVRPRLTEHGGVTPDLVGENMRAVQEYEDNRNNATANMAPLPRDPILDDD